MADLHRENPEHLEHAENHVHHEESDVDIRRILGFGAGLLVVAAVVHVLIYGLFVYFDGREGVKTAPEYPLAAAQGDRVPPEPRLQTDPRQDLADLRAKEDELLGTAGVVDQNAGIYRIPIETAMRLTLERGLPARTEPKR